MGRPANTPDRVLSMIDAEGPCWEWQGAITGSGYGTVCMNYVQKGAHRAVWEILVGPIPDDMHLDHLCRNTSCVNPDHLEVVTPATNTHRGHGPSAENARKTQCKRGHPLDAENTYREPSGARYCKTCRLESKRRHNAKRRSLA